jgi:ATP-dependent Clp endopeptidase proteolytic subunit ClpP
MASNWYDFKASADTAEGDLYLYGEVGGWGASASEFIAELASRKDQHINLHIHSPGGSVFEGHAIFNALRNHPGGVTTMVDGIAASMASVIAMAGKPVKIASNGFLMIHNPWSQAAGGSEEMRKQADVLDKLKDSLVKIYADKSGMSEEDISAAMDAETWFSAQEAVDFGLADEVFEGMKAAAKIDLSAISAKAPSGVFQFANPWPAPQWMRDNFRKGLDWFEKGFGGDGLADSTIEEARAIASGNLVSPDKAQRMAAWFARHMGDLDGVEGDESNPTPGMVRWHGPKQNTRSTKRSRKNRSNRKETAWKTQNRRTQSKRHRCFRTSKPCSQKRRRTS